MMTTYIALLRGINVSGKNSIKMEALRQLFTSNGLSDVKTYIQSGNIIFKSKKTPILKLENTIQIAIKNAFGFDTPVFILEPSELINIAKENPFLKDTTKDILCLYITLLEKAPLATNYETIKNGNYQADEFIINDRAIYLYCPNGYGKTKLTNTFFENKLKIKATTRNWKTVSELLKIASSD